MSKIVYQTDDEGVLIGPAVADESPLEPGVWLIPRGCVETPPPALASGEIARFVNGRWTVESGETAGKQVQTISLRQFAMQARDAGFITQAEAVAFLSVRAIPAAMQAVVDALPTQIARDDATLVLAGMSEVDRSDLLVSLFGEAMRGETPLDEFLDGFFRAAGAR